MSDLIVWSVLTGLLVASIIIWMCDDDDDPPAPEITPYTGPLYNYWGREL